MNIQKNLFSILYLVLLYNFGCLCDDSEELIIKTPQGQIKGTWKSTINGRKIQAFMGIPFAKPPVGKLRFKDPEPIENWNNTWNGTKEGSECPQLGMAVGRKEFITGKEDCLYLNVFRPNVSENKKYPVLFFIHGGGWTSGSASPDIYGPDMLLDKDIVLVTANYRIGILGFASTEDEVLPGNLGLKDQVMAMKWIKDNIASYGGDPNSVTIFGQSAGGASVHYHMLSPKSKGLFHRAIPISGTVDCPWAISAPGKNSNYLRRYGEMYNCSATTSRQLVDCLSTKDVSSLITTSFKFSVWEGMEPRILFTPVFEAESENAFITEKDHKSHTTTPIMSGVTKDEGSFSIAVYHILPAGINGILSRLDKDFEKITPVSLYFDDKTDKPEEVAKQMRKYYFNEKPINLTTIPEYVKLITDTFFHECERSAIKRHDGPAYLYYYAYDGQYSISETLSQKKFRYGVAHADDLQYIFPIKPYITRENQFNENDKKASENLVNFITNFVTEGKPTPGGNTIDWKPRTANKNEYLFINGDDTEMKENFLSERMELFQNIPWNNKLYPKN